MLQSEMLSTSRSPKRLRSFGSARCAKFQLGVASPVLFIKTPLIINCAKLVAVRSKRGTTTKFPLLLVMTKGSHTLLPPSWLRRGVAGMCLSCVCIACLPFDMRRQHKKNPLAPRAEPHPTLSLLVYVYNAGGC
jgi:hypothetical protein